MRIALGQFRALDERALRFAAQIGASGVVVNTPTSFSAYPWPVAELVALREQVEASSLRLEAIENVPLEAYRDAILGGPQRERCVADYRQTLRNLGAAGIDVLGLHWMADGVTRTEAAGSGRGGARVTVFEQEQLTDATLAFGRAYHDEELWAALQAFFDDVVPVAEQAGVRIALHPDDPPVPSLRGVPHLLRSVDALERAMLLHPSSSLGLDLCLGTVSEMGEDPVAAIRRLGAGGHIAYVHFRDVQGTVPSFRECFLGEGNVDPAAAMRALRDVGFDGFIIDDHVPLLDEDPEIGEGWAYHGHAHGTGYLQGLLASVASELSAA